MGQNLQELTRQALRLSADDRVVLAESLLLTIDETHDHAVDASVIAHLQRRLEDFRQGTVVGIPGEQALQEIRQALKRIS